MTVAIVCSIPTLRLQSLSKLKLAIDALAQRHTGLTEAIASYYAEAARVCLDRHHQSPVDFEIDNAGSKIETETEWQPTDNLTRGAWANKNDATEAGACAFVLAAVELTRGMVAVHRAETQTGADYYIASPETPPEDLEGCLRLEVSGTDTSSVARRLKEKLDQLAEGASNLPALAGVAGFKAKLIMLKSLEGK